MSILLTKVRQPQRRKDLLRRVRLVDSIHQNIHRKLTFVSAPAGYGKTTLLIDFASDIDANVCWYLISPDDKDLVLFVRHILASFQQQFPDFGIELGESLNFSSGTPNGISIAIELINEIETKIDDFTVLVLDDYHLAGENEAIVEFIEKLIEHLPDQLRILIGSRSVYGIPTANLYIRDELVTISAEELRFRPDELQKLVLQNYHLKLSDEQAEDFASKADGWIVAILLALRAMDTQGVIPKLIGGTEKLYEYLAEEVVNRQSPELRDFLYSTSILGDFNEEIVNYVREKEDSSAFLQSLEERNLFVTRTEMGGENSYRYHQLFSEFLQDQFEKHDARRLIKLHNRAAEWHKDHLEWESAIHHKLNAKEHETAAEWIDAISFHLYTSGRQNEISNWYTKLNKLGKLMLFAPHLGLYQAKILGQQYKIKKSQEILDYCEPILREKKDNVALANVLITRGMLLITSGENSTAIKLAAEATQLLDPIKRGNEKAHQLHQAERLKGLALNKLGEIEKSSDLLKTAIDGFRLLINKSQDYERQRYRFDLAELLTDFGFLAFSEGQALSAQKAFREALDLHISAKSNSSATARNNIAYVYHQTGRYELAWKEYSLALKDAKKSGRVREELAILSGQGSLLFDIEDYENAKNIFNEVYELGIINNDSQAIRAAQTGLSDISRINGQHAEAMNLLRDAASHEGTNMFSPFYTLRLGRIYFEMGQTDLAYEQFEKTISNHTDGNRYSEDQILASFFVFIILSRNNNLVHAQSYLDNALKETANLGYDQFLLNIVRPFIPMLKENSDIKAHPQLLDLVKRAKKSKGLASKYPSKEIIQSIKALHIEVFAFAKGKIRVNNELIPSTSWKSSRARTLFYYILDQKRVTKEKIGLAFWPDFSAGKISSNFHATLWRVRQAFPSKEIILFNENQYFVNPDFTVWYDVDEFENFYKQAKSEDNSRSNQIELFRQTANLYKGSFLSDVYMDWAINRKSDLENKYLESLESIALFEKEKGLLKNAGKILKTILTIDPYLDKIHLIYMDCLIQSGEKDKARSHFQTYKALLKKELNTKPMPELQNFYTANQL